MAFLHYFVLKLLIPQNTTQGSFIYLDIFIVAFRVFYIYNPVAQ